MDKVAIGSTGLSVTPICFGTSSIGNMPDTYGYEVGEARARETLHAIFDGPVNFLDTSNNYGFGSSEKRVGAAIAELGGLPDGFVVSTKLDRDMETGRFDRDRARLSLDESIDRLGIETIPMLHLHDPEHARDLKEITKDGGALDTLFRMKEEGIALSVGLAMGRLDVMAPILRAYPFDALISHNRYTLLNRSANEMFDYAHSEGMAILNAAPYAGGVLAKGSVKMPRVTYQPADDATLKPVKAIETLAARHGLAPGALALQFSMRDKRVASTIVGVSKPQRVEQTLDWAAMQIEPEVWAEIADLSYSSSDPEADRDFKPG